MLSAVLADFSRLPNCRVVTTWDGRLGTFPDCGVEAILAHDAERERLLFEQLARSCDASFVIAPEIDAILANRRKRVDSAGGIFLGASREAIELCTDKLLLAKHFQANGIPTIQTKLFDRDAGSDDARFPLVLKRRDGAGSLETALIPDQNSFELARSGRLDSGHIGRMIVQPYLRGRNLSVAAIISVEQSRIDVFPIAEQHLSGDGRFRFLGGRIPAFRHVQHNVEQLVHRACVCIPGLCGYVGFDFILPDDEPNKPLLVEINPRLTTSYLGYRALSVENISERIIFPARTFPKLMWKRQAANFQADGTVTRKDRAERSYVQQPESLVPQSDTDHPISTTDN